MPKLGDLGGSVDVLRDMRDRLVENERVREVEDERWGTFGKAAGKISQACESRELEDLVVAVRELKNRLRRPAVRKELARLEAEEEPKPKAKPKDKVPAKKEKNPTGECKCAQCGKVIDGSKEPCIEGALCTNCALKSKVIPKDKQKKKKTIVPGVDTGGGGAGGGGGSEPGGDQEGDVGNEKKEARSLLRRRGYLS